MQYYSKVRVGQAVINLPNTTKIKEVYHVFKNARFRRLSTFEFVEN